MTAAEPDLGNAATTLARTSQRERVKASQDVAAALARELRGPVVGITSAAQLLRYRITDDPVIETNIGRIMRETERLSALVETLLEYGRPGPVQLAPANPDDVWVRVLNDHRGVLQAKALLASHTPANPCAICDVDAEQLGQAFSNALANAIDAAPEGSDLAIRSGIDPDGTWESSVRNDGSLIEPDTLLHAFEPLVSTKPGHPGIGLAIAHRVVCDHGGSITLASGPGNGTTLTFRLPASHG